MKPEPRLCSVCRISRGRAAIIAEELRGKIFERIAHLSPHDALGVDIDDGGQDFRHGQHRRLGSRIGLRKTRSVTTTSGKRTAARMQRASAAIRKLRLRRSIMPEQVTERSPHCQLAVRVIIAD